MSPDSGLEAVVKPAELVDFRAAYDANVRAFAAATHLFPTPRVLARLERGQGDAPDHRMARRHLRCAPSWSALAEALLMALQQATASADASALCAPHAIAWEHVPSDHPLHPSTPSAELGEEMDTDLAQPDDEVPDLNMGRKLTLDVASSSTGINTSTDPATTITTTPTATITNARPSRRRKDSSVVTAAAAAGDAGASSASRLASPPTSFPDRVMNALHVPSDARAGILLPQDGLGRHLLDLGEPRPSREPAHPRLVVPVRSPQRAPGPPSAQEQAEVTALAAGLELPLLGWASTLVLTWLRKARPLVQSKRRRSRTASTSRRNGIPPSPALCLVLAQLAPFVLEEVLQQQQPLPLLVTLAEVLGEHTPPAVSSEGASGAFNALAATRSPQGALGKLLVHIMHLSTVAEQEEELELEKGSHASASKPRPGLLRAPPPDELFVPFRIQWLRVRLAAAGLLRAGETIGGQPCTFPSLSFPPDLTSLALPYL